MVDLAFYARWFSDGSEHSTLCSLIGLLRWGKTEG
jgi:hypothetical protein